MKLLRKVVDFVLEIIYSPPPFLSNWINSHPGWNGLSVLSESFWTYD